MSSNIPTLNVNVLPDGYRRHRLSAKRVLFVIGIATAVILVYLVYQATFDVMNKANVLQEEVNTLSQEANLRMKVIQQRTEIMNTIGDYNIISEMRGIITEDIAAINTTAEEAGITVTSISYKKEEISISCQATSHSNYNSYSQSFEQYCNALIDTGRFSDATYPSLDFPPTESVSITLSNET